MLNKICEALNTRLALVLIKAINEQNIEDPSKKRLAREIAPLLENLIQKFYHEPAI